MSLDWNITNCVDADNLLTEDQWPTTEFVIFSTMVMGIGEITEENVSEYFARIRFYERLNGTFFRRKDEFGNIEDFPFPAQQLRKYVGLTANVSYEKFEPWVARISEKTLEQEKRNYFESVE